MVASSPPLAPAGPLPDGTPMPGPCDIEDYDDEPPKGIRHHRIEAASLEGKPLPDREWLVRDLIPAKNVTLLYGDGGTGKSLLALQLAAAVVMGTHFFGRLVAQGRVESSPPKIALTRCIDASPLLCMPGAVRLAQ
jgi:hypothetical protein